MSTCSQFLDRVARKLAIIGEATNIVIDISIYSVCQPIFYKLLSHCLHLWNMVGCFRIDMRRQNVQLSLVSKVLLCIRGGYLISRATSRTRFVLDPVFTSFLDIVLEMPNVGDVTHKVDIVAIVLEHTT